MTESTYVLAGQASELERLQLQSRVWEPAGRRLLGEIGDGEGTRVLDVGCGAMGSLRLLSEWVGPAGQVVGTDNDEAMLSAADGFVSSEGLGNVALMKDDIFATDLAPDSFDLVHARYQLSLGRSSEQMAAYLRLVRPGGIVVLEDVDPGSWHCVPPATAPDLLLPLIATAVGTFGVGVRSSPPLGGL
ncbi:MAG: class I SAM-dependent methyltransferase, partial [Actinobacteria bacterium]|nr:class I SAM-dependent methyltransferase [Actinomycetota bacterium]